MDTGQSILRAVAATAAASAPPRRRVLFYTFLFIYFFFLFFFLALHPSATSRIARPAWPTRSVPPRRAGHFPSLPRGSCVAGVGKHYNNIVGVSGGGGGPTAYTPQTGHDGHVDAACGRHEKIGYNGDRRDRDENSRTWWCCYRRHGHRGARTSFSVRSANENHVPRVMLWIIARSDEFDSSHEIRMYVLYPLYRVMDPAGYCSDHTITSCISCML